MKRCASEGALREVGLLCFASSHVLRFHEEFNELSRTGLGTCKFMQRDLLHSCLVGCALCMYGISMPRCGFPDDAPALVWSHS